MKIVAPVTALLLVVSGAATAVSGPASAAARPTVTLARPSAHTAGDGSKVHFHGTLAHTGTRNDKTVVLQRRYSGRWHRVVALARQDDGRYAFPGRRYKKAGTFTFRTVVRRNGRTLDVSPVRRLVIRKATRDDSARLQIRASDRIRANGCKVYDNIAYNVDAARTTPWSLEVTVTKPGGAVANTGTLRGTGPRAGRYRNRLCSTGAPTGNYRIRAVLTSSRFSRLTERNSFALTAATGLLPDLRMRNLNTCSAAERTQASGNGGTGCFYIHTDTTGPEAGLRLLKFPATTFNLGDGPMEVRSTRTDPGAGTASWSGGATQRIYDEDDSYTDVASPATFYWESVPNGASDSHGHQHWHMLNFDDYSIVGHPGAADEKHGFCLQDNTTAPGVTSAATYPNTTSCGYQQPNATSIVHGLSVGWGDTYPSSLPDQGIDIGGLPDGTYTVTVEADAQNVVQEKIETNNSVSAQVTIVGNRVTHVTASGGI